MGPGERKMVLVYLILNRWKEEIRNIQDALNELLLGEEELIKYFSRSCFFWNNWKRYRIGEVFVQIPKEEAENYLEQEEKRLNQELQDINSKIDSINKTLAELKVKLMESLENPSISKKKTKNNPALSLSDKPFPSLSTCSIWSQIGSHLLIKRSL